MIKELKLTILFSLAVLATTTLMPDKNAQTKVHHKHTARKSVLQHRQNPSENCNLICPGQPPLSLPPNFLHNCTSVSNTQTTTKETTTPAVSTTKPNTTTSNSTSTEESGEESSEDDTETSTATTKSGSPTQSRKLQKQQAKKTKKHHGRKHFRKERILLNKKAKSKIFKHRQMQGRSRLDGCYVICSDGNQQPGIGRPPNKVPNESENEDSSSEEDDNYVQGEDTPIEIIYVPQRRQNNVRPVDIYQTNNYWNEMWQPEPAPPFGYDPFFFEEKRNNIKKIKKKNQDKKKPN
ncbi:uncharacterized protein LOC143193108 isoform X1 [Rhynchophorus ferrugineus]|uniref:uncharacterized protein LOC143193108 isoform X1 n=1 Tax=Rhynchophorus ferrugineus TaxID=354439 RepID=UPI003FCC9027